MADNQGVTPGTGTQGNREEQKNDASKGADTKAPGTPAPQPGGPAGGTSTSTPTTPPTRQP